MIYIIQNEITIAVTHFYKLYFKIITYGNSFELIKIGSTCHHCFLAC